MTLVLWARGDDFPRKYLLYQHEDLRLILIIHIKKKLEMTVVQEPMKQRLTGPYNLMANQLYRIC